MPGASPPTTRNQSIPFGYPELGFDVKFELVAKSYLERVSLSRRAAHEL